MDGTTVRWQTKKNSFNSSRTDLQADPAAMSASSAASLASSSPDSAYDSLAFLLAHPSKPSSRNPSSRALIEDNHRKLRYGILTDGIPDESTSDVCFHLSCQVEILKTIHMLSFYIQTGGRPSLRPTIWKILLRVSAMLSSTYLEFVSQGNSSVHEKSTMMFTSLLHLGQVSTGFRLGNSHERCVPDVGDRSGFQRQGFRKSTGEDVGCVRVES